MPQKDKIKIPTSSHPSTSFDRTDSSQTTFPLFIFPVFNVISHIFLFISFSPTLWFCFSNSYSPFLFYILLLLLKVPCKEEKTHNAPATSSYQQGSGYSSTDWLEHHRPSVCSQTQSKFMHRLSNWAGTSEDKLCIHTTLSLAENNVSYSHMDTDTQILYCPSPIAEYGHSPLPTSDQLLSPCWSSPGYSQRGYFV